MSRLPKSLSAALVALAMTVAALAQSSDADYCKALSEKYKRYVGAMEYGRGSPATNGAMSEAMANCPSNPAGSIPTLEKALKDARLDLPPRN